MRMLIISFIFLIIIIFLWMWFHFTSIEVITSYFSDNLEELSNKISNNNWDESKRDMEIYNKKWEETRNLWIYFLNQNDVNNIDISIKMLDSYVTSTNEISSQAEIEKLKMLFNVIKDNECLSLENIF